MRIFKPHHLLWLAAACYLIALALPAVVYKPDVESNPKLGSCHSAVKPDIECLTFRFGETGFGSNDCRYIRPGEPRPVVDKQKILDYCEGYDQPVAKKDYGILIYFMGWLGIFAGVIAWYANITGFLAVLYAVGFKNMKKGLILAVVSFVIGLQSFFFTAMPRDEGVSHWFIVDYLGPGFYLWEASFIILALYCYVSLRKSAAPIKDGPSTPK